MKKSDLYHKWIEWSEEDQVYIGKCPDLISGIHGDHPVQLYSELCEVIDEVLRFFKQEGRPLPPPTIRPMKEVELSKMSFPKIWQKTQNIPGNIADEVSHERDNR